MPNTRWIRGQRPRCSIKLTSLAGTGVDPTSLKFRFMDPNGVQTEYVYSTDAELVRDAAGQYHVDVPIDTTLQDCKYYCRWEARDSDGVVQAAAEHVIEVVSDYKEPT